VSRAQQIGEIVAIVLQVQADFADAEFLPGKNRLAVEREKAIAAEQFGCPADRRIDSRWPRLLRRKARNPASSNCVTACLMIGQS
jgi:hypothetical protein